MLKKERREYNEKKKQKGTIEQHESQLEDPQSIIFCLSDEITAGKLSLVQKAQFDPLSSIMRGRNNQSRKRSVSK